MLSRKKLFLIVLFVFLSLLYFSIPLFIYPDSLQYYNYLKIFQGTAPLSSWDVTRGASLPLIIFIFTSIFGNTMTGILIATYIFFVLFIVVFYQAIKNMLELTKSGNLKKIFIGLMFIIFIVFNPILFGYYHSLLTEFVATTLALIFCLLSWKWIGVDYYDNKRKYFFYNFIFIILFIFAWFLKQPYFSIVIFPLFIAYVISIIKNHKLSNVIQRSITLFVCMVFLFISIFAWKQFLQDNGVNYSKGRNNEYFLSNSILKGVSSIRYSNDINSSYLKNIDKSDFISNSDKEKIKRIVSSGRNSEENYYIVNILSQSGEVVDIMPFFYEGESYSTDEAISFWAQVAIKHPFVVAESYYSNYLASINIYISGIFPDGYFYPTKTITKYSKENHAIGLSYLFEDDNFILISDSQKLEINNLYSSNDVGFFVKYIFETLSSLHLNIFKVLFLILPVGLIGVLVKYKKILKKSDDNTASIYELIIILFGFSFLNALFHSVTGAIIDRYIFIAFPEVILGIMLFIMTIKNKTIELKSYQTQNAKLLFVIPAYNESLNIGAVIKDIKKNVPEADVLVVNDCSKDNTREIVEGMGVKCITMPFNVRYAMAVQTGIKYARDNDYGYVIQFDADGQHLASEAKKLFAEMKKTGNDIVIGSRFIKKTSYKHSLPRMLGTKLFAGIIHLFSGQKITDPTSGLQCLNRRVIEKYSKLGAYPEYPDANLILEMIFNGYKISEVGVEMKQRENGESMHSGILKPVKYMVKISYAMFIIIMNSFVFRKGEK